MPSVRSQASPRMLKWARESAHLSVETVAEAEKITAAELAQWESGHGSPSLARLARLARRYKRPLMVFYLAEPPTGFTVVKDFRLLPGSIGQAMSPRLVYAIRRMRERQVWASEFLREADEPLCAIVGSSNRKEGVAETARRLRELLNVSIAEQVACPSESKAFSLWKSRCEALGVFVFQVQKIPVKEMRGCAFSDKFAPIVAVNMRDTYPARTFTLMHEMAHIFMGQSVIDAFAKKPPRALERYCDAVAAEVLMPSSDFRPHVPDHWKANAETVVANAARRYRVSRLAVLLKLADEGFADAQFVKSKWRLFNALPTPQQAKMGGPEQHELALRRNGEMFSRLVTSAYYAGDIHGGELYDLLGMKLKHLPRIVGMLYPCSVQPNTTTH